MDETLPPPVLDPRIDKSGVIRKFDSSAINKQLDTAIASLPPGTQGAIIGVYDDNHNAHLAVIGQENVGNGTFAWSVSLTKPHDQPLAYGGQVRYSWPRRN